jgi:hypothetical protein
LMVEFISSQFQVTLPELRISSESCKPDGP